MLTYNGLKYTKKAVEAIQKNTTNYELIIIDNGSTDGTVKWLKKQKLHAVFNKQNVGVAAGRNQGIALARYDIVVFLDNDTEVGLEWTNILAEGFQEGRVGIICKRGVGVITLKPLQFSEPKLINGKLYADVGVGFCLAIRRKVFDILGGFYTKFPYPKFWHEDLEFGLRVKASGYDVLVADIPVVHHEHKSAGEGVDNEGSKKAYPGFDENAAHIATMYRDRNILTVFRDWGGYDNSSSYDRYTKGLIPRLRDLGMVVLRKSSVYTGCLSFDLCKGFEMEYNKSRIVTLHQENDRCPAGWRKQLETVDYIFPASEYVREVCKDESYADKMLNCGIGGIEDEIYNFDVKPKKDDGLFKFLMVSASQPRKNTLNLIGWYCDTFTIKDKVILIIKDGDYGQSNQTRDYIKAVQHRRNCPRIQYIFESMESHDLARLYKAVADHGAYIHPHRAEALGLPILEAIACGCRVGTTDWGGPHYTTKDTKTVTRFSYTLKPSSFHNWKGEPFYDKDQKPRWAEPDEVEVKDFMQKVVREPYDRKLARQASQLILSRYSYKNVAKRVYSELLRIHDGK